MIEYIFANTITGSAAAYAANDVAGGRLRFPGVPAGWLRRILITDKAALDIDWRLVLFMSQPSSNTSDNAPYDPDDADLPLVIVDELIDNTLYRKGATDNSYHLLTGLKLPVRSVVRSGSLWGYLINVTGGTAASTTDMGVRLDVEPFK